MEFKLEIKERVMGGKELVITTLDPDNEIVKIRLSYYLIKTMEQLKNKLSEIFDVDAENIIIY